MPRIDLVRRGLLMLAASYAAGGFAAAYGKNSSSPRAAPDSAKLAGAFVNWGAVGRERTLQDWEKWLNQKPSSVIAVDFYGEETWEQFSKFTWVPGIWKKLNPARIVVWSMPLTMKGTPLADIAGGQI